MNNPQRNDSELFAEETNSIDLTVSDICIETSCTVLSDAARTVEGVVADISSGFMSLTEATHQQSEVLDKLLLTVSHLDLDGEHVTLQQFTEIMDEQITKTVDKIVSISENSVALAGTMEDVMEKLENIESHIMNLSKINNSTRMLALNATIEAERAGEAGRGFAIVASEVKKVSSDIDVMSHEMKEQIQSISMTLRDGQDSLQEVAQIDMSSNIAAREKLSALMQSLLNQNDTVAKVMRQSAESVKEISSQIGNITIGIQFQDKNTQIIDSIILLLQSLKSDQVSSVTSSDDPARAIEEIAQVITLSEVQQQLFLMARQRGLNVEQLIHQEETSHASPSGGGEEEDDIELF